MSMELTRQPPKVVPIAPAAKFRHRMVTTVLQPEYAAPINKRAVPHWAESKSIAIWDKYSSTSKKSGLKVQAGTYRSYCTIFDRKELTKFPFQSICLRLT